MLKTPLSVFETVSVREDDTARTAMADALELAQRLDQLGYDRLWVAEHHTAPAFASSAPAVLISHLAAKTSRLRIGSGAVILPYHSPLAIAEQFGTLELLNPGRIDLGIGRGPGADIETARLLRRGTESETDTYASDLAALLGYFGTQPLVDGKKATLSLRTEGRTNIIANPGERPEVWVLGSSPSGASLAARHGLPFAFGYHLRPGNLVESLEIYRHDFRPSKTLAQPYVMLSVSTICAESDEQAEKLAEPSLLIRMALQRKDVIPVPTPESAENTPYTPDERQVVKEIREHHVLGGPETVRQQLLDLIERTGADELMLETVTYEKQARIRSFELISEFRE